MHALLAHLTPLEMPVVWIAFALGLLLGVGAALLFVRSSARRSES